MKRTESHRQERNGKERGWPCRSEYEVCAKYRNEGSQHTDVKSGLTWSEQRGVNEFGFHCALLQSHVQQAKLMGMITSRRHHAAEGASDYTVNVFKL